MPDPKPAARKYTKMPPSLWPHLGPVGGVYGALSDHLRPGRQVVRPHIRTLRSMLPHLSERSIQRALRTLEAEGFIRTVERGGGGSPTKFFIAEPGEPEFEQNPAQGGDTSVTGANSDPTKEGGVVTPVSGGGDKLSTSLRQWEGEERKREEEAAPPAPLTLFDSTTDTDPDHPPLPKPTTDHPSKQGAGSKVNRTGKVELTKPSRPKPTTPKADSLGWNPRAVFDDIHQELRGRAYPFAGNGKGDPCILADVAKRAGVDGNRSTFEAVVRKFLTTSDQWIVKRGRTVSTLATELNRILDWVRPEPDQPNSDELQRVKDAIRKPKERTPVHV